MVSWRAEGRVQSWKTMSSTGTHTLNIAETQTVTVS